jgi:hypothetical protein
MSGILGRTAFMDQEKGYPRFHDYCVVNTALGNMVEFDTPFQRGEREATYQFDPNHWSIKVDKIEQLPMDRRPAIVSDGDILLHEVGSYYKAGY